MARIDQSPHLVVKELTDLPYQQVHKEINRTVQQHVNRARERHGADMGYPYVVGAMQVYLDSAIFEIQSLRRELAKAVQHGEYWEIMAEELRKYEGMTRDAFDEMLCDMERENGHLAEEPEIAVAAG